VLRGRGPAGHAPGGPDRIHAVRDLALDLHRRDDRRGERLDRAVPAGTYSVGLLAAFQPEALGPLFEDLAVGTPSRFLYLAGSDPTLPDDPPPWPGGLAFELPDLAGAQTMLFALRRQHLRIVDPVAAEIRAADLARQRGAGDADPWHAHRNLLRLKVAALLAILDGRLMANEEDWGLAGLMVDTSDAVRQAVQDQLGDEEQRRESQTATRLARRAVTTEATLDNHRTQDAAKRLWQMATKWPGAKTPGQARVGLAGAQRAYYEAARDHAVDAGWIEVRGEAGQGSDKVRLWPGANRP
jgi:Arc/MetJ-type ribon-helix-helix transcriptional regulator